MEQWQKQIQQIIAEIDRCIRQDADMTLSALAEKFGYSEFHLSRKFREVSGMSFRDYLRYRRLAFALKDVRDTEKGLLEIAMDYGFSSNEAFTRAFREAYGVTPSRYRANPIPVVLRTQLHPFDCYLLGIGGTGMAQTTQDVKNLFRNHPRPQISAYPELRKHRILGFLAETGANSRTGLRDHLRPSGKHPRQAGRSGGKRSGQWQRPADGLHQ